MQPLLKKHYTAIRKLFFDYGIASITMDDIAISLHISKKTIYREYVCKNDLVKDLFMSDYQQFRTYINSLDDKDMDAIAKTIHLYDITLKKIFLINASVLYDLRKYFPSLLDELTILHRELLQKSVASVLLKGKADKFFHNEIMIDSIAQLFTFLFESYVFSRISGIQEDFIPNRNDFLDYHFRSVCSPSGLKKWETLKKKDLVVENPFNECHFISK